MNTKLFTLVSAVVVTATISAHTQAIPAFARKYNTACSSCHSAWPQLNDSGRKFKEAGYRFAEVKGEKAVSDFLNWDRYFPTSAMIKSRPYDKKGSGDDKARAIHEIELMIAGSLSNNVSTFFELEAEDEDTNSRGFEIGIPEAVLTYSVNNALNLQAAWGSLTFADPYDTYSDSRRLTRGHASVVDQSFGGADAGGKIRDSRQSLSAFGRLGGFFYNVGYAGVADDSEGENPSTVFGRLAYEFGPNIAVGLLAIDGTWDEGLVYDDGELVEMDDADYTRLSFDSQIDIANFRFMGVYTQAEDDVIDGNGSVTQEDNDAFYLQGQYMFMQDGRPTFVPMVRFDQYEKKDGAEEYKEYTLNLGYYFTENIRGYIEYWDRYDVPKGKSEDDRLTVQVEAVF